MANGITQIADIVKTRTFARDVADQQLRKNEIWRSGAIVVNNVYSGLIPGSTGQVTIKKFDTLDNDGFDIATDNTTNATDKKVDQVAEHNWILSRSTTWAAADLAVGLSGDDALGYVTDFLGYHWATQDQETMVAQLRGFFGDNAANDGNDLIHSIVGTAYDVDATAWNASAFIAATAQRGDRMTDVSTIICHSTQYARLLQANLISFVQPTAEPSEFGFYLGRRILVDDNVPNGAGASGAIVPSGVTAVNGMYTAFLLGPASFVMGIDAPPVPAAFYRDERAGTGYGIERFVSRVKEVIHLRGATLKGTALTAQASGGPSNASTANNFGAAASWDRVSDKKNMRVVAFVTREHAP